MEELRWGLVGAGDIAEKRVAPALTSAARSRLVAVCRRRPELAEDFARRHRAGRWHADWRDLLADPEIDAVYVATPVNLHAPIAIAAAEAGKHVLCEKPMALNLAECDDMVAAASAHRVQLGVAYYRHAYPILRRVKELLASAAIGLPILARVEAFEWFDPPPTHSRYWLLDPLQAGGGPMFDFGSHRIEVLLDLLGPIAPVASLRSTVAHERAVEDTAAAVLGFESGAVGTLTVSHAVAEPRDTLDLFGTAGSIHIPRLNGPELRIVRDGDMTVEHHPPPSNLHQPLIQQFVDVVLDGGAPMVDGHAGREVNRVLAEIYA